MGRVLQESSKSDSSQRAGKEGETWVGVKIAGPEGETGELHSRGSFCRRGWDGLSSEMPGIYVRGV